MNRELNDRAYFYGILLLIGAIVLLIGAFLGQTLAEGVPACVEDEIVVGHGNFERDSESSLGHWEDYQCGHPDNL